MKTIHNNEATLRASAVQRFLRAHQDRRRAVRTRRTLTLLISLVLPILFLILYILLTHLR